jgi:hypothetical protein
MTVAQTLSRLLTHPGEMLLRRWNWKAALLSSLVRGLIFFAVNLSAGWRAASGAMFAEWVYRAFTSGFFGAVTQTLGEAEPEWLAAGSAMVLLPLSSHSLEFLVHWLRHTPNLRASIISSLCFTVVSTLFNIYAMRRGTMIVGRDAPSLREDLRVLPRVIFDFPFWLWRALRGSTA